MVGKSVSIIGAGPAGLIAAETLAKNGAHVTVYDRMPTPARKLLIAGRGGLNLTHSEPLEIFLTRYGTEADWLAPSIHSFTPSNLRAWCESLGQETFVGSSGRVFPTSMKAVELLRAWLARLETLGVRYLPRHRWLGWKGDALHFRTDAGEDIFATPDATVLALGGASWPRLGSDGAWTSILEAEGIPTTPLRAANSGFCVEWSEYFRERFAGEPLKPVEITHHGASRQGEAMMTANGIEGGVIYALSRSIRSAIECDGTAQIQLDLRPNIAASALAAKFPERKKGESQSNYLRKCGLSPLVIALLREEPATLAAMLKATPLTLTATAGIERAISSAGGIPRSALTDDFMLRAKPGIFAAGEMLDWEAPTGGYLLQACYSTGIAAAHGVLRYLR
jgi:uncharacterized flavoprotein (TIGR03862 family)